MAPQKRQDATPRPHEAIGKRLAQLRAAYGLNQTEFTRRLGLKPATYSLWESGERRPGIDSAIEICGEFKVTLDWLYMGIHEGLSIKLAHAMRHGKTLG